MKIVIVGDGKVGSALTVQLAKEGHDVVVIDSNKLVLEEALPPACAAQAEAMAEKLREAGLNIDWFPTNFIPHGGILWYVDYECNSYMEQWDFPHWGRLYWSKTPELLAYAERERGV